MNICMTAAYDGSRFAGWQKNKNTGGKRALQDIFELVLSDYFGQSVKVTAAGRTDAGVSALGQVLNFHIQNGKPALQGAVPEIQNASEQPYPAAKGQCRSRVPVQFHSAAQEQALCGALNRALQAALSESEKNAAAVRAVRIVPERFHSRFDAIGKTYLYLMDERERPHVFTRACAFPAGGALDVNAMRSAAAFMTGTHDFRAFTSLSETAKGCRSTIRTITELSIDRITAGPCRVPLLCITVTGDGFLYHAVRILAGTLYEVGTGKRSVVSIAELFGTDARRSEAGMLLPGEALFLKEVYYQDCRTKS